MRLQGFARTDAPALLDELARLIESAPFRQRVTPSGQRMSVAMSNCGALGWVSDRTGYRSAARDPQSGQPWPSISARFLRLAHDAAAQAGCAGFVPDACLINRYLPDARLSLHQDRDERDLAAPIVSVALGLPVVFLFGDLRRQDPARRRPLAHGDVLVGGSRPVAVSWRAAAQSRAPCRAGGQRINLTFRQAG